MEDKVTEQRLGKKNKGLNLYASDSTISLYSCPPLTWKSSAWRFFPPIKSFHQLLRISQSTSKIFDGLKVWLNEPRTSVSPAKSSADTKMHILTGAQQNCQVIFFFPKETISFFFHLLPPHDQKACSTAGALLTFPFSQQSRTKHAAFCNNNALWMCTLVITFDSLGIFYHQLLEMGVGWEIMFVVKTCFNYCILFP